MKKTDILPNSLYEDIKAHQAVLFAGAGISTEAGPYGEPTLYATIKEQSKYPKGQPPPTFPDLMQYFCDKIDGGQRNRLTKEIITRIGYFAAPSEINNFVTMFHHLVAEMPYFDRIVTTNWDPFFERALNILVPMVEDKDLVFWDDNEKQVLKLHGCVTRPYTIVATRDDYKACIERYPLIFNKLRDLIVTKTFVFTGYSLQDADFRLIFDDITLRLGTLRKLAYAYDPNATTETVEYWRKRGVSVIKAMGEGLLSVLRARLEKEDLKPTRKFMALIHKQAARLQNIHHERYNMSSPGALISAMYQDGLLHGLNDLIAYDSLGKSTDLAKEERELEQTRRAMIRKKDLVEIAYYTGRHEVIRRFNDKIVTPIPPYWDVGRMKPSKVFRAHKRTR